MEEALRIKEKFSGKVTAISMGPPQAKEVLQDALAMGADEAVLLCDMAFAGADTLATAYPLARGIQKLGHFDLIICGNETVDGATAQVGPQLAEFLGIPHITSVIEVEFTNEKSMLVKRALEHGYLKVEVEPPVLITVLEEINEFRLPSIMGIMEASSREIKVWDSSAIEADKEKLGLGGSPTRVTSSFEVESKRRREVLEGSPQEATQAAIKKLRELGAI
jgi:electron transfer flavoprotein beta subunit